MPIHTITVSLPDSDDLVEEAIEYLESGDVWAITDGRVIDWEVYSCEDSCENCKCVRLNVEYIQKDDNERRAFRDKAKSLPQVVGVWATLRERA